MSGIIMKRRPVEQRKNETPFNESSQNEKRRPVEQRKKLGGDDGDRTHDLGIANAALSQLSYVPKWGATFSLALQ